MDYKKLNLKLLFEVIVTPEMRNEFKLLQYLHNQVKSLKKTSPEKDALAVQIKNLRVKIKAQAHSQYIIKISNNRKRLYNMQIYNQLPEPLGFKETADLFIEDIRQLRKETDPKNIKKEHKNMLGFQYQTVGGVFLKQNSIMKIGEETDPMRRIGTAKTPHPKIKGNFTGFELELMCRMDRETLCRAFIKEGLAGYVYVKNDSSIRTEMPGDQAHEVTALCKQGDVKFIMAKICKVLNAENCGAKVNNTCGFHLHLDMRNRDPYHCYNNLVKMLPMLNAMVPPLRVKGAEAQRFCKQNLTSDLKAYYPNPKDLHELQDGDRYQAINPAAVQKYKTLEVRLHSGTTNFNKIFMWSNICVSAIEAPLLTETVKNAADYARLINSDTKVCEYIDKRMTLFIKMKDAIDTKTDHAIDMYEAERAG